MEEQPTGQPPQQPGVIGPQQQPVPPEQIPRPAEQPQPPEQPSEAPVQAEYQYQSGQLTGVEGYSDPAPSGMEHPKGDSVSWSGSEFIDHQKNNMWYVLVFAGAIVLAGITYLLTRSIFGVVIVVLLGVIISVFGALKPRVLDYQIGPDGIQIGDKHYDYLTFRSFAIIEGAQMPSIQLLPQKRFAISLSIYFDAKDADHIVEVLGEYLPFEHRERDLADKLSSKLHF